MTQLVRSLSVMSKRVELFHFCQVGTDSRNTEKTMASAFVCTAQSCGAHHYLDILEPELGAGQA